jgi:hypothetical protein
VKAPKKAAGKDYTSGGNDYTYTSGGSDYDTHSQNDYSKADPRHYTKWF